MNAWISIEVSVRMWLWKWSVHENLEDMERHVANVQQSVAYESSADSVVSNKQRVVKTSRSVLPSPAYTTYTVHDDTWIDPSRPGDAHRGMEGTHDLPAITLVPHELNNA